MSARTVTLTDAIIGTLNDKNLAVTVLETPYEFAFTAVRKIAPFASVELEELKDLQVLVFSGARNSERVSRNKFQKTYKPIVAIQRRLDGIDAASKQALADQLILLCEQIEDVLENRDMADGGYVFESFSTEDREPYNAGAMQGSSFYSTIITPEYKQKIL